MTDFIDLSPPKPSKSDAAYAAVKTALSAIPLMSAPAVELFQFLVTPPIEARRDDWRESIATVIKQLIVDKKATVERLSNDPAFIDVIFEATHVAMRTSSREKLDALKNAVVNSAVSDSIEPTKRLVLLNRLGDLTEWHLLLLKFLDEPREWMQQQCCDLPNWWTEQSSSLGNRLGVHGEPTISLLEMISYAFPPDFCKDEEFLHELFEDLLRARLISKNTLRHSYSSHIDAFRPRTTNLGKDLLKFVSSPPET